jgi:rRNA maturation endonuclease Nob1
MQHPSNWQAQCLDCGRVFKQFGSGACPGCGSQRKKCVACGRVYYGDVCPDCNLRYSNSPEVVAQVNKETAQACAKGCGCLIIIILALLLLATMW